MRNQYKALLKAPWSKQKVSTIGRFFSGLVSICLIYSVGVTTYFSFKDGVEIGQIWIVFVIYLVGFYGLLFFGYIASQGNAPVGWLPWRRKRK